MSFTKVLNHAVEAYSKNFGLISKFAILLVVSLPLALILPNFVALSGIFVRLASVKLDLSILDSILIMAAIVIALFVFSFAIAAINVIVKSQRTLNRLHSRDMELIRESTLGIFFIYLTSFAAIVAFNLLAFEYGVAPWIGMLFSLIVSLLVLFAPQAGVIEDLGLSHAIGRSVSLIQHKFLYFIGFLAVAAVLILVNTWIFLALGNTLWFARFIALAVQTMAILPFLEVLKTQIYLSKYSLL